MNHHHTLELAKEKKASLVNWKQLKFNKEQGSQQITLLNQLQLKQSFIQHNNWMSKGKSSSWRNKKKSFLESILLLKTICLLKYWFYSITVFQVLWENEVRLHCNKEFESRWNLPQHSAWFGNTLSIHKESTGHTINMDLHLKHQNNFLKASQRP